MKSSEQVQPRLREKSGQVVAKQKFGKTDTRYWQEAVFKPSYRRDGQTFFVEDWAARVQWRGRRELFNLRTPNKATAAAKARDVYVMLVGAGWEATLAKFKPDMERRDLSTVGDFLNELSPHWSGKEKTFADYSRCFRTILSQMFGIEGHRAKFDYVNGGRDAWVAQIDAIKLADVTPERVNKWRIAFVRKAGDSPLEQKRARITCNSLMRQARSLFAPELLAHVAQKPEPLPFDGVAFYERESMRYHSAVDIEALIEQAMEELPQEQLKIFLLATMAALRRNEIDKLPWSGFRWNDGIVRIETTKHFAPKTADSAGDIPIDAELVSLFRGWHAQRIAAEQQRGATLAKAKETVAAAFVVEADSEPIAETKYTHYRAHRHFDALNKWLRSKGVEATKPLHELRKECGSQICAKHGIHAASRLLRHTDISLTAAHYADQTRRVTFGMGNLLKAPSDVTPIDKPAERDVQVSPRKTR
jgi:hypothetical protein